ncbi:hypothetical protein GCK72_015393 [Caenorhabditis remanei]|uniref:Uncharacterized protein n=1 Tax=Caenorhabditis remanei TaxID=31234 RepID=A0A6A5GWZ0_CAERE|nr:hypothetical protein GCK72_015393 [Caenorhabditis remanei]KAF1758933.1 hypothetical protein GCK72_015393 [Caenorhabditis remanei]
MTDEKCGAIEECPSLDDTPKRREAQKTYEIQVEIDDAPDTTFSWRKLWAFTGPGFLMSIAYLDPGNIESDLQAGAISYFKLIWVLLIAHIMGLLLQRLAARLGVVSGKHMAEIAYSYYPKVPRLILWLLVESAIVGSDMQEVIGTAISFYLLSNGAIPLWAGVLITICDTFTFLFLEKYGVRKFEAFFCFLITCMAVTFGYEFGVSKPNAGKMFTGMFVPWCTGCDNNMVMQGVAIIGAVIMPHNFYLHSALVKSRKVDRRRAEKVTEANKYFFIESAFALFVSFIINTLVISVFAQGMFGKTNNDIRDVCYNNTHNGMPDFYRVEFPANNDAAQSDIYHAGIFLGCTFGIFALYVWAVGILAAGQSSTMTGTYAGQFAMEGFIQIQLPQWKRILITRSLAILPTLAVVIFSGGIDNISSLNDFLNCLQLIQLPFALIPVLTFVSDKHIMHEYKLASVSKAVSIVISLIILFINFYFLYSWIGSQFGYNAISIPITVVFAIFYIIFIAYLTYYCLVAMEFIPPIKTKWLAEPIYYDFDAPWLETTKNSISSSEESQDYRY